MSQDLDRCVFKPPQTKSQLFNSYTQLEGGRIKYVNFKIITNPKPKTTKSDWVQNLSGTPECASSLWRRWKVRISASGGPLDIVFPKLPKTSSLSWNSVRCVVEGKGGYLKGNSLTVSETRAVESKTGKKKFPGLQTVTCVWRGGGSI